MPGIYQIKKKNLINISLYLVNFIIIFISSSQAIEKMITGCRLDSAEIMLSFIPVLLEFVKLFKK